MAGPNDGSTDEAIDVNRRDADAARDHSGVTPHLSGDHFRRLAMLRPELVERLVSLGEQASAPSPDGLKQDFAATICPANLVGYTKRVLDAIALSESFAMGQGYDMGWSDKTAGKPNAREAAPPPQSDVESLLKALFGEHLKVIRG